MTASDERAPPPSADRRLPELFARAQDLEGEAQAAWLGALRREEPALALEVEELLAAAPAGERRFATPPWERLSPGEPLEGDGEPVPERVGTYRVVREIGRGGMGRVFLAEQEEAEFRRTVALKLLRRPAGDADSLRRFRAEARILATLEHPGIARLYDAGRGEDGGLYLALEYVAGDDLLSFVRSRGLDRRARVELFVQVLDAVDFAHRRLVVHRDLKPANVIVDAEGRPKLLDFGISKVLDAEGTDGETRTGLRALTPAYASPEQLRGEPVTTASDVY
ncbi:MAG TPA: serine/threonine-protein kinase, partial [Thermoanaerobaculia bacterium]|nr:serine/threonine-protein kinase [Thermoanaerobaculia bacterium]